MKNVKQRIDFSSCLIAITVIACAFMIVKGIILQPVIGANRERAAKICQDIEYEKERIKEIDALSEKAGTDEYTEKVARDKLGMIKSDEIVFIDISGQ